MSRPGSRDVSIRGHAGVRVIGVDTRVETLGYRQPSLCDYLYTGATRFPSTSNGTACAQGPEPSFFIIGSAEYWAR